MERHDRVYFEIAGLTMIFHGVALDRHPLRLIEPVLRAPCRFSVRRRKKLECVM
jgi:hypothetical protein